eukprot:gene23414-29632_t
MATVSEVRSTTLSGLNHIDALLNNLPNWNYQTSGGNNLYYSFSTAAGLESGNGSLLSTPQSFSAAQQTAARSALNYISQLTGIKFTETADGNAAQVHFANANISGSNTTGLDSSRYSYSYDSNNVVTRFTAATWVYLDNAEWGGMNANLAAGTQGYETLLHELGHAMGLKHSFEGSIRLPAATDNTAYTLMSYTHSGGVHATFGEYDIAALNWLYGGDGLGGALGAGGVTIDASNGSVQWGSIKAAGADFAYIAATGGADRADPMFARNIKGAAAAGVQCGPIHRYDLCRLATDQAANFIRHVPRRADALPAAVWLDYDDRCPD